MSELESERRLREESERRRHEVTDELLECRAQLHELRERFERMEETLQELLHGEACSVNPSQPDTTTTIQGSERQLDAAGGPARRKESTLRPNSVSAGGRGGPVEDHEKINSLLERLQSLEAENSALALENESQREQYERCLDKVANEVVQALLTQKDLREECVRLRTRVGDLEQQNHTLSILFQQKLCLPTSTGLQAALAAPGYEGGSLRRLNPTSPGSSCSSSDLSLSSSCSEISISSCPRAVYRESAHPLPCSTTILPGDVKNRSSERHVSWLGKESPPLRLREEVRAHVHRYPGGPGPRDSHEDALQRQRRKENSIMRGLRQLVSRDGFMCEERIGLLPSEWPGRDCMSSNEGIYSPGCRPALTMQNSQHLHVKKHSYESDSQDDSGEDSPITQVAVSCHDWTLPSCLRLSHDLPEGFFGLGSHGDLLGSARCLSRLQASMPRCQRQRRRLNSGESRASLANHAVKNGIERHDSDKRRPHKGVTGSVTKDSRCIGMKDDQRDPNVRSRAVSVTHMLHRTDAGCVTALCSQVVSLASPSVALADSPSMLQFVRSLAGSPGKEDCQQGLSSTRESTGSSTLAVSQEEPAPVDYMVLDPEGSLAFEINNGTAISPTDEEPSHDDSASPHHKVAVSSIVALTTNVSSDSMVPAIPATLIESKSQPKLIKPMCSPKHKSGVVYSVSFAAPGISRARPSSSCSPQKSRSLPQGPRDSERQCNTNENEPMSNENEQDKASSPFNSGKSSVMSSPAKLSRYLKVSTTGNATKNVDSSCLKTKGERGLTQRVSHLPRNSRSPSKSGESPTKHINCSNGGPTHATQDVSTSAQVNIPLNTRMPIVSSRQFLNSNATLSQPTAEIPTTSLIHSENSSGTVSPEQPEEPVRDSPAMPCRLQAPSPPGRSASLLIRPNYDIPPSMTLLRPNYGSPQTQAHHGKVRLAKEKSASTKMASKLPTSSPSHAARSTMITPNRLGAQRPLLLGTMTETSQQVTFIYSQPKLPLRTIASAPTSPMHVMESEKIQVVKVTTAAEKESNSLATQPMENVLTMTNGVKSKPHIMQNSSCSIGIKELPSNGKTLHPEHEPSADSFLLAKQQTKYGNAEVFSSKIGIMVGNPQMEVEAMIPPLISCCTDSSAPRRTDCTESEDFQSFSKQAPQSPSCTRPYAKPALGMSGTKARSLSFSAHCSPRDRVLPPSSPGDLSPRTRTHIITNTAERGSPLARQLSSPMPESPRTVPEPKSDGPLEGAAAQSSPSLYVASNSEQNSFDSNEGTQCSKESPKALSPNQRKWGGVNCQGFEEASILSQTTEKVPKSSSDGKNKSSPSKVTTWFPSRRGSDKTNSKAHAAALAVSAARQDDSQAVEGQGIYFRTESRSPLGKSNVKCVGQMKPHKLPTKSEVQKAAIKPESGQSLLKMNGQKASNAIGDYGVSTQAEKAVSVLHSVTQKETIMWDNPQLASDGDEQVHVPRPSILEHNSIKQAENAGINWHSVADNYDLTSVEEFARCPEQDKCNLLLQAKPNSMVQIISTRSRTEDGGGTDQPSTGHHSKDRSDSKPNTDASPESISKTPSSPGASIEEKVMLGIQANVIRKSQEQQSCSRTSSTTADGKPRSGAASSFANWFGFRRNKASSVATVIPTEIEKKGSNRDVLGEGKKGGETPRKEEKREWTALGRRLKAKGKRADGKQESVMAARRSPEAEGKMVASPGKEVMDCLASEPNGSTSNEFLQEILSRAEKRPVSPNDDEQYMDKASDLTQSPLRPGLSPRESQSHMEANLAEPSTFHISLQVRMTETPTEQEDRTGKEELLPFWRTCRSPPSPECPAWPLRSPSTQDHRTSHSTSQHDGGGSCGGVLKPSLQNGLSGESIQAHEKEFQCQMRTLDSGIGTFPPLDPASKGVGRSSSRRWARSEDQAEEIGRTDTLTKDTCPLPPSSSDTTASNLCRKIGLNQAIVQGHSKTLVATTAVSGGGDTSAGSLLRLDADVTARAQTLERKLSSVPDKDGICHSLSDPTVATRIGRSGTSRLPKPVIAGPVKLPASTRDCGNGEAAPLHPAHSRTQRSAAGVHDKSGSTPLEEHIESTAYLTESSSEAGSDSETCNELPSPLHEPPLTLMPELHQCKQAMRMRLLPTSLSSPVSLLGVFHRDACNPRAAPPTHPFGYHLQANHDDDDLESEVMTSHINFKTTMCNKYDLLQSVNERGTCIESTEL
uniref:nck-associated protein 5-like n=1 Tax=Myxine glutinosa TaxID=7769 RepID=UPI00358F2746